MTKAVGDFLGTVGIADEMIRFNGFPFLEKDDEAYNVPGVFSYSRDRIAYSRCVVSRVMKTQLHTIPASGLCIRDVGKFLIHRNEVMVVILAEDRLKATDVKGFPVVSADEVSILIGYIDRSELRYVLGMYTAFVAQLLATDAATDKARRVQNISSTTPCSFASDQDDHIQIEFQVDFPGMATGPAVGIDEDISMEILETTATPGVLKFWPWVNQVRPLYLTLHTESESVMLDPAHCYTSTTSGNGYANIQAIRVRSYKHMCTPMY